MVLKPDFSLLLRILLLCLVFSESNAVDNTPPVENISTDEVQQSSSKSTQTPASVSQSTDTNPTDSQQIVDNTWIPEDSDLRLLEVRVESYRFDEVVDAYQYKDVVLIPLGTLSGLLDIAIDITTNQAQGFIIKENNTFFLDTARKEVVLKGESQTYENDLVKELDYEIYVESNLLAKWLNMKLDVDLFSSRITVKSELKLPFLARIDREKRMGKLSSRTEQTEQQYPRHYESYKNYTPPFIDETLSLSQKFSDNGNITSFNSTTHATADLFQHESSWYLTMDDQNGVNDFRVTFGRTDPDGDLLGPINAKEYKFGHIAEPRIALINSSGTLKHGVSVSNFPIGLQTEYDRHRFFGELLPGWEVELYHNNALIGYQQTPVEGQYDFQDIPLRFGNNYFRLVFYGPKGEIREETKTFQLSSALTKKGELYYRASTIADDNNEQRTVAEVDYGISKNISGTLNLVSIPLIEATKTIQHNYTGAGLIGYWDLLLASANVISDSEGGSAIEIDLQTRISETVIGLKNIQLDKFYSEEFLTSTNEIVSRSQLDINTAIPPTFLPRIPLSFGFKIDEYANGDELRIFTNQISLSLYGAAITNSITNQQLTNQQTTSTGNLQISSSINKIMVRGTIGYALKPEKELSNIALTVDPGQFGDYRLSFGINRSLQQNLTEISATANKVSGKYGLSFGARYNSDGEINLDANFSIAFGYEPRREQWKQDAANLANQGSVSARFFLDTDKDGIFGKNDTPIKDMGVRVNQGYNKERSDEDGILFLTGLTPHSPTDIIVASGTMEDPLWVPALDGVRVVPRPGHAIQIDFPIFTTGEIDGTVELVKGDRYIGVGDVTIELVDINNHVIKTTTTAYDGFYILSHIPMGEYTVRVSNEQLAKLGLISADEEVINISGDEPFVNGIDFSLKQAKPN